MWLLIKTAWRNLFRQSRRTAITVSAMAISLILAIPSIGLMEGLKQDMDRGITGMELGHFQVHNPAYARGRALQSTLRRPDALLATLRATKGVKAASPRVHGFALASHDQRVNVLLVPATDNARPIRFGRGVNAQAPWRKDRALACEVLVSPQPARHHSLNVGTVLTPEVSGKDGRCERLKVVGVFSSSKGERGDGRESGAVVSGALKLHMPTADIQGAFASSATGTRMDAVIRHSATLSLYGVDPRHEPDVSFMSERVVKGRYLGLKAKGELVVGYRLAKTLKLKVGAKLFVQAGALDQTQGSFYRDFLVVGIYRTGVDFIDRSRVFLHIADAQALMTLGTRIHEIAIIAADTKPRLQLKDLKTRVRSDLVVLTQGDAKGGTRAGSEPLPAPLTVYEPQGHDARLLIPYDLKRRFEDIEGIYAVTRRIYGAMTLAKGSAERTLRFVGVEPVYERRLSALHRKLVAGSFLPNNMPDESWPLLLSESAAAELSATVGDTLVVRGKDEDGALVTYPAKVQGIIDSSQWSTKLPQVVLPYYAGQQVDARTLNARAHELLLVPKPGADLVKVKTIAEERLVPLVRSWQQIAPDLAKLLETQDVWMGIFMLIIFGMAAMTVMNTMLMAVFERTREFGVLKSLGMRPRQVFALIVFETLALAMLAAVVGGGIGALLNHLAVVDGIDLSKWSSGFTYQGTFISPVLRSLHSVKAVFLPIAMMMLVCLLVSFYPAVRAGRLKPVDALRHHN